MAALTYLRKRRERLSDETNPYAFVFCHGVGFNVVGYIGDHSCGTVALSREQYIDQMQSPDVLWMCPNCGATATYLDEKSEKAQEEWGKQP